jgi:hypothetical protein
MKNKQKLIKTLQMLEKSYNFEYPADILSLLTRVIESKNIDYNTICDLMQNLLITVTKDQWNQKYGFKGYPTIADWLEMLGVKEDSCLMSLEEKAGVEVAKIFEGIKAAQYGGGVIFDNQTTNACVENYGGISQLIWDLDKFNDKKRDKHWVKKELKEEWITCKMANKTSAYATFNNSSSSKKISYIGNKEACKNMIENVLENHNKKAELPEIKSLASKFNCKPELKPTRRISPPC